MIFIGMLAMISPSASGRAGEDWQRKYGECEQKPAKRADCCDAKTGAGWTGGIIVGLVAAALTLGIGQFMLAFVRPLWLRLAIAMVFVAPAALAGYHATHGIVKHTMPSDTWQIVFSVIGAIAVGVTAFVRVAAMAAPGPSGRGLARA